MKKLIGLLCLLAITLCTCVQAQDDANINPLSIARAFAIKTPAYFECTLYGNAYISNSYKRVVMRFVVRKSDFAVTNLIVNDREVPLSEPTYSLPLGGDGMLTDVNLNVTAYDKDRNYAGNGYTFKGVISKDDVIEVLIRPADTRHELPVDIGSYGNNFKLVIEDFTYGYGWGVSGGKFYAYVPPVGGKYNYTIRLWETGEVVGSGVIEPFKDAVTPDDAYFGIKYMGNVIGIEFTSPDGYSEGIGVSSAKLNCSIPMDGRSNVLGKVIFTDVGTGRLEVRMNDAYWVYVQQATENGEMPFLELEDRSSTSQDGWVTTLVATKERAIGKVVISVIPKNGDANQTPWINLQRFYGPWNTGGYVPEKGRPGNQQ